MKIVFDAGALRRIGEWAVARIVERTQEGLDVEGRPFPPYSERPLSIPAGALWSPGSRTAARRLKAQGQLRYWRNRRTGSLWVTIQGGYRAYKEARFPGQGGQVNLTLTGTMMRSLAVLDVETSERGGVITIGFRQAEAAERAYWHEVTGAGRSRVRRRFLGLTPGEMEELERAIVRAIEVR